MIDNQQETVPYVADASIARLTREIMLICVNEETHDILKSLIFILSRLSVDFLNEGVSAEELIDNLSASISKSINNYYKIKESIRLLKEKNNEHSSA